MNTNEKMFIGLILYTGIGPINAVFKNLAAQMGIDDPHEVARRINSEEWVTIKDKPNWYEKDGVIRLFVTSEGMTGPELRDLMIRQRIRFDNESFDFLSKNSFTPTPKGTVHKIAILTGKLFEDLERTMENILTRVIRYDFDHGECLHPEIPFLIRAQFSDRDLEKMGLLKILVLGKPVTHSKKGQFLFNSNRYNHGNRSGVSYYNPTIPGNEIYWDIETGFACLET